MFSILGVYLGLTTALAVFTEQKRDSMIQFKCYKINNEKLLTKNEYWCENNKGKCKFTFYDNKTICYDKF